ncbi:septum formation protein Maf [Methylomonas lenta]|uniref:dTTP/UTP pyrophosphatase n=1 Tax=Methylomonas lenta TaxID=980561 RepID=A0A177ND12_9GAMM|nr:nucleoside triphosphate pyrophosphatase [Methylomonas lenta]OAI15946.1 septum formation protein Maf [Methylomonas lenta]
MTPQIVLASASPRRSELLQQIGIRHVIKAVDIDETPWPHESPLAYVERVATEKSAVCRALLEHDLPVLAADTSVVCDGRIMGKPDNLQHASEMLMQLSGRSHQVYSAVSLRGDHHWQAVSVSEVRFRTLTQAEILAYWQTGEPQDKAGAYAIQGLASIFIESITGSFSGVMGLPLFETAQLLAKQGIKVIA